MASFAAKTKVPVEKTRIEIERLVKKYGAKGFVSGWQGPQARIEFLCADRHIRLSVIVSDLDRQGPQKWRTLLLLVKAKLAGVEAKIVTFEQAFVGDIVMPDGRTVWEATREPIKLAYEGKPVQLLEGTHGRTP
jgi:hypothetical protein